MVFPVKRYIKPISFLNVDMAKFGARRSDGKRKHAGCDIYTYDGEPVYAINDGVVFENTPKFYYNVGTISIRHNTCIIRYGEVEPLAELKVGTKVIAGQLIGHAKQIYTSPSVKMNVPIMVHLEMYSEETNTKPLTDMSEAGYKRGYARRADVCDPTSLLTSLLPK